MRAIRLWRLDFVTPSARHDDTAEEDDVGLFEVKAAAYITGSHIISSSGKITMGKRLVTASGRVDASQ